MVENPKQAMLEPLLGNTKPQGNASGNNSIIRPSSVIAAKQLNDPDFWPLAKKSKTIQRMQSLEIKNTSEFVLEIQEISEIMDRIIEFERNSHFNQFLNPEKIVFELREIMKGISSSNRIDLISEKIEACIKGYKLDYQVEKDIISCVLSNDSKYEKPKINPTLCQSMIEIEANSLVNPALKLEPRLKSKINSVAMSADGSLVVSGLENNSIIVWTFDDRKPKPPFQGHSGPVTSVAVTKDGKFIVSGSKDKSIIRWNIKLQKQQVSYLGHNSAVRSVCVTSKDTFTISASDDRTIKIWNNETKKLEQTLEEAHTGAITTMALSQDDKFIVSGSEDCTFTLWDFESREQKYIFPIHGRSVLSVAITSDRKSIISASEDNTVRITSISNPHEAWTFEGHKDHVTSVAITANDKYVVTASKDKTIRVLDLHKKKQEYIFEGHKNPVTSVVLNPDCSFILSGSSDNKIRVWNLQERMKEWLLEGHSDIIRSVCVIQHTDFCSSSGNTITLWNMQTREQKGIFKGHTHSINSLAVSPDNKLLVSGSDDKTVRVWNIKERKEQFFYQAHSGVIKSVIFSPMGDFIISGSDDCKVCVWSIKDRKVLHSLEGHKGSVLSVTMAAAFDININRGLIISGSLDNTIRIWEIPREEGLTVKQDTLNGHTGPVLSVAVSSNYKFVVSGSGDNTIRIWSVIERKELWSLSGHTGPVYSVAISEDCRFIVSGSQDETVRVWNFTLHKEQCVLTGHMGSVYSVAIDKDSLFMLSGSADKTIRIWNKCEWGDEFTVLGHMKEIYALKISIDDRFIVSGSRDSTIKIWNVEEHREEEIKIGHSGSVYAVAISPDLDFIVSGSRDLTIRIWNISDLLSPLRNSKGFDSINNHEKVLKGHKGFIRSVAVSRDSKYIVSGSTDHTVKIWNIAEMREEFSLPGHSNSVNSVDITDDFTFIVSGSSDHTLILWSVVERRKDYTFNGHKGPVLSVVVSPNQKFIVSGSNDSTIRVWKLEERKIDFKLKGHTDSVLSVAVNHDSTSIVSASKDWTIKVWSIADKKATYSVVQGEHPVRAVTFTNKQRNLVAFGSEDGRIRMWNVSRHREVSKITIPDKATSVECSKDGKYVAVGYHNSSIKIWDVEKRKEECTLNKDCGNSRDDCVAVITLSITKDNKFLVSGSLDRKICIWDIKSREQFGGSIEENVEKIIVVNDGKLIISKSFGKVIKIWDFETQKEEKKFSMEQTKNMLNEIVTIQNYKLTNYRVFSVEDCLILASSYEIIDIIKISKDALSFSSDLEQWKSQTTKYNFLYYLSPNKPFHIPLGQTNASYGAMNLTLAHLYCHLNYMDNFKKLLTNSNFRLLADRVGRSPFYYAILRKRQDFIDLLLVKIEQLREEKHKLYDTSIFAISNDLSLIIQNSPKQLHHLLAGIMKASKVAYDKVPKKFPNGKKSSEFSINPNDFIHNSCKEVPCIIQCSIFPLIGELGCAHNQDLLEAISKCTNSEALKSTIITQIIDLDFNKIELMLISFTSVLFINIMLLLLLIGLNNYDLYLSVAYIFVNILLAGWKYVR